MSVLKARIGGAWVAVPMVGPDEVYIGATAPADSAVELWYDTAAVPAVDPAKMPRGYIGSVLHPGSDFTTSSASTIAVPGTAVQFPADPSRTYKTTITFSVTNTVAANLFVGIANAALSVVDGKSWVPSLSAMVPMTLIRAEWGLSGSQTRQLVISTSAGSVTAVGTFARAGMTLIEDIGGV